MSHPIVDQANEQNFDEKIFGESKYFGGSDVANKLSGEFWPRHAKQDLVKIQKKIPAGLEVHLEDKTQNHDLFISPKQKITELEISLKSSIMSKLDHQMSKI